MRNRNPPPSAKFEIQNSWYKARRAWCQPFARGTTYLVRPANTSYPVLCTQNLVLEARTSYPVQGTPASEKVVLSFGGFLGMGKKLFALPWGALTLDAAEKRFILDASK
jgi:hypothetical protein